jgi:uncharacterized membrane protein YdjX (TVP38/TMEM64 family)
MRVLQRYLPLALLAAVVIAVFASGAGKYLSIATLREHQSELRTFVAANLVLAVLIFIGVYAAATAVSLPGAIIITLTGGFLFGPWLGGAASVVGATIGAILVFLIVRTSLGASLRERAEASGGRLKAVIDGVAAGAFGYILTLRLIPVAPFWLVNVAAALANAPLRAYALATFIGIIPGTFIYAGVGSGIGKVLDAGGKPDLSIITQPYIWGPLSALALLSLGTTLFQRYRARKGAKA